MSEQTEGGKESTEQSDKGEGVPALSIQAIVPVEEASEVEVKAIGDDLIRVSGFTKNCSSVGFYLDMGSALELISDMEDSLLELSEEKAE